MSGSERGEEAGEQSLDSMNKNYVKRHGMPDKLAKDSKVQRGSKQSHVNAARVRRKLSHLSGEIYPEKGRSQQRP